MGTDGSAGLLLQGLSQGCKQSPGFAFHQSRVHFQAHVAIGWISLLAACQTEGFSFLPAVVQTPPAVSGHVGLSIGQLITQRLTSLKLQRHLLARWKLLSCIKNHGHGILCHILLVRSHMSHPHPRGGIPQRHEYQEAGIMGLFGVCPPQGSANCKRLKRTHFRLASQFLSQLLISARVVQNQPYKVHKQMSVF